MITKVVLVFGLFVIVVCAPATSTNFSYTYSYNLSNLPITQTKIMEINGAANTTLLFDYQGGMIVGPEAVFFQSQKKDVAFLIVISNTTTPGNHINNIMYDAVGTNLSGMLTFNITVINDTNLFSNFVLLDYNIFSYRVCNFLLPQNFTFDRKIKVSGRAGQIVYTSYNKSIFNLPDKFTIPQNNYTLIDVFVTLPNWTKRKVKEEINFSVSQDGKFTIYFEVIDCIKPPPALTDILQDCVGDNLTVDQIMKCYRAQAQYWGSLYNSALSMQEEKIVNVTEVKYVDKIEYKQVLEIDDMEIVNAIKELPTTTKQLIVDNRQYRQSLDEIKDNLTQMNEKMKSDVENMGQELNNRITPLVESNVKKDNEIRMYESKYISKAKLKFWFFVLFVVSGFLFFIYKWNECNII